MNFFIHKLSTVVEKVVGKLWKTFLGVINRFESNLWENCGKVVDNLWETCGKPDFCGKPVENLWKTLKICGKPVENFFELWKTCGKPVGNLWKKYASGLWSCSPYMKAVTYYGDVLL